MRKRRRSEDRHGDAGHVGQVHGRAWKTMEWYVPFKNDRAFIYHGHDDPDDHSQCGPQVFCCPKAAYIFTLHYPLAIPPDAEWSFTDGKNLASWLGTNGPRLYYFFVCDPDDWNIVRFTGIAAPEVREVLLKRLPLDRYLQHADWIGEEQRPDSE